MLREQFQADKVKLNHDEPTDFSVCWWQKTTTVHPAWLFYRALICSYFIATTLPCIIWFTQQDNMYSSDKAKFLIYLTFWTYFVETVMFFCGFLVTALDYAKQSSEIIEGKLSTLAKVFWVLYTIVLPCAVSITITFWAIVQRKENLKITVTSVIMHITNSALIVIDFVFVAFPYRFLHVYMPYAYLLVYVLFSVIYELSGGTGTKGQKPIYKILDWKDEPLVSFAYVWLYALLILILHLIFSGIYLYKLWMREGLMLRVTI